jgi:serpin B
MATTATLSGDFAARLYDKLAGAQAGKNLFLSPFSIQVALAMCAVDARGETRDSLTDLIGAPENVEEQNIQYAALLKSFIVEGDRSIQLVTANAMWGQQGYPFKAEFQEAIADFYDAALHKINFSVQQDQVAKTINAWIDKRTNGKIKDLIQRDFISQDVRLIITNQQFLGKPYTWRLRGAPAATHR